MNNVISIEKTENHDSPFGRGVIRLYPSGKYFDLVNVNPDNIEINDIAWSLSKTIRYNGHIKYDYTVARHSIIMSYYVDLEHAMEALLHDAGEAYVGDLVAPLKEISAEFEKIEDAITAQIMKKYNNGIGVKVCPFRLVEEYHKTEKVDRADKEIYHHECYILGREGRYVPKMQIATKKAMAETGLGNIKVTGKTGDYEAFMNRFVMLLTDNISYEI